MADSKGRGGMKSDFVMPIAHVEPEEAVAAVAESGQKIVMLRWYINASSIGCFLNFII